MKQNLTVQVDENAHSNQQAATFEKLNHGQSTDTKKATVFVETLAKQTLTPKKTTSVLMPKTPVLMPKTPVSAPEEVLLAATDEDMLYDFECEDIDIEDAPETSDSTHIHVAMKSWVQDYKQSLAGQKPSGDAYYPKPHRLDYMLERGVERCPPLAFSRAKERQQPTFSLSPVPLDAKVIAEIKMRKASLPFPTTGMYVFSEQSFVALPS